MAARFALLASVHASGIERARRYAECANQYEWCDNRGINSVVPSAAFGFAYYQNPKAASTTIRVLLKEELSTTWFAADVPLSNYSTGRISARHVGADDARALFRFSFVRHPVAKFEAGVRQVRANCNAGQMKAWYCTASADDIIANISVIHGFINEHFVPSGCYMQPLFSGGETLLPNFIGATEAFGRDFVQLVGILNGSGAPPAVRAKLAALRDRVVNFPHAWNTNPSSSQRNRLSPAGIRTLWGITSYRLDFRCLGYPPPF